MEAHVKKFKALKLIAKAILKGNLDEVPFDTKKYLEDPVFSKNVKSLYETYLLDKNFIEYDEEEGEIIRKSQNKPEESQDKENEEDKQQLMMYLRDLDEIIQHEKRIWKLNESTEKVQPVEKEVIVKKPVKIHRIYPVPFTIALAASFVGLLLALSILIPQNSKLKDNLTIAQQDNKAKSDSLYLHRRILNEKDSSLAEKELLIAQLSDEEKDKLTEFIPEIARLKLPGMKATENMKGGGGAEIIFYQSPKAFYNLNEPVLLGLYTSAQFKIVIRDNKSREVFSEIPAIADSKAKFSFTPKHAGFYVYEISLPGDTVLLFQSAFVVLPAQ